MLCHQSTDTRNRLQTACVVVATRQGFTTEVVDDVEGTSTANVSQCDGHHVDRPASMGLIASHKGQRMLRKHAPPSPSSIERHQARHTPYPLLIPMRPHFDVQAH